MNASALGRRATGCSAELIELVIAQTRQSALEAILARHSQDQLDVNRQRHFHSLVITDKAKQKLRLKPVVKCLRFPYFQFLVEGVPSPQISERRRERTGHASNRTALSRLSTFHFSSLFNSPSPSGRTPPLSAPRYGPPN